MRWLQKLVRNGNSTQITIPRQLLGHLGWLPGEPVIVEVLEDKTVALRRPQESDFAPKRLHPTLIDSPSVLPR